MKNPSFLVNGRRAAVVIAWLVMATGGFMLLSGLVLDRTGATVQARYQIGAGKLLRSVSPEDQKFHSQARVAAALGGILEILGLGVVLAGLGLWWKPPVLQMIFQKLGWEKDIIQKE